VTVNIHQAKTRLSELLVRVAAGETIIIAKAGHPVAQLTPISRAPAPRKVGSAKGLFRVPPEFFEPVPEDTLKDFGL
jgi:prevent-host-death family protein